jgi:hypothetical protein
MAHPEDSLNFPLDPESYKIPPLTEVSEEDYRRALSEIITLQKIDPVGINNLEDLSAHLSGVTRDVLKVLLYLRKEDIREHIHRDPTYNVQQQPYSVERVVTLNKNLGESGKLVLLANKYKLQISAYRYPQIPNYRDPPLYDVQLPYGDIDQVSLRDLPFANLYAREGITHVSNWYPLKEDSHARGFFIVFRRGIDHIVRVAPKLK